jgi:hypothetical protein
MKPVVFYLWFSLQILVCFSQTQSPLVFVGAAGKLEYTKYANRGPTNLVNQFADFSWAGYKTEG